MCHCIYVLAQLIRTVKVVLFLFATNHFMCPYSSLQRYLKLLCIKSQEEALFCHQSGDVMTRTSFLRLLQLGLQALMFPQMEFLATH